MVQIGPRPAATRPATAIASPEEVVYSAPAEQELEQERRRYTFEIPIDPRYLPYIGLMLVALALRLYDLGAKALHHDESLHAFYSWRLYVGQGYIHDPMMHGPLLFIANAAAFLIFGDSDFTARLVPALLGVAVVGMPFFLRNELGKWGSLAAGLLLAVSPSFLYFSRFLRHDIYVDAFTLMMVIGVFRYLATAQIRWFYATVVGAALLFATKEDFYISGFILFAFLAASWFILKDERRLLFRARVRSIGWQPWAIGLGMFLVINILLYTTFLTNLRGFCTMAVTLPISGCAGDQGALNYWLSQQDYARGGQPWFYYFMLLPLYEFLPLALGIAALFLVRGKNYFFAFSVVWFVMALEIYSWAGEKMPWMLPQIAMPLIFLAARLLGQWAEDGWGKRAMAPRGLAVAGILLLCVVGLAVWIGLGAVAATGNTNLLQQTVTLQRLALAVLIAAGVAALVYLWQRWGRSILLPGLALGALLVFGTAYVRTSFGVVYDHPDTPSEPLIYVQSSHDVVWVTQQIDKIAQQTGKGNSLPILLDNGWGDADHESVAWPFEWYLRNYPNRRYYTKTIDPSLNLADYPVIIARTPNIAPIQDILDSQYRGQVYALNWWFPEDYKAFDASFPANPVQAGPLKLQVPWLNFPAIADTLSNPDNRLSLLKFLVYRQAPDTMGRREMSFYVRKDLPQDGPAPTGSTTTAANAPASAGAPSKAQPAQQGASQLTTLADGTTVFGLDASGKSIMQNPKGVAVGPDGRVYTVEADANRVTVFNPDGTRSAGWGTDGQGDGQFHEPWGIAIAPNGNVYVADTWNHRVEYFDPNGKFLGKWGQLGDTKGQASGSPGIFWGPRAITISPAGEVYVTDTGNKRIEVFDLTGNFRRAFGGAGSDAGQLNEPVGLAFNAATNTVLVADTWNGRVQQFDPNGTFISQFPLPGDFANHSVTNKLYLTISAQGNVVVTYPDTNKVLTFNTQGQQLSQTALPKGGSPVGVASGPDGRLYVADAHNGQVDVLPAAQ